MPYPNQQKCPDNSIKIIQKKTLNNFSIKKDTINLMMNRKTGTGELSVKTIEEVRVSKQNNSFYTIQN